MPLGFTAGPQDLLLDDDGKPIRIDKAFSWEAPLAAHGMMHMVIANAWAGDPYPIDTLFLFMANMAWNSSMNTARAMEMLTDKDAATGEYSIPHMIYSDAFFSETVPYADLILPDTTYLERWDCISMLDRPICERTAPADAIRQPVLAPDRDVRPFQDVLIELGARLKLPGLAQRRTAPEVSGDYPDYIANHERGPASARWPAGAAPTASAVGSGAPIPSSSTRYIENECFWRHDLPASSFTSNSRTPPISTSRKRWAYCRRRPDRAATLFGAAAEFPPGRARAMAPCSRRMRIARASMTLFRSAADLVSAARGRATVRRPPPLHAITQRPMIMYHSWGSQNAWLRQIYDRNHLYINATPRAALGIADDDWVWVISRNGRDQGARCG